MNDTVLETEARHQIPERVAAPAEPHLPPGPRRATGSPTASAGRRPDRQLRTEPEGSLRNASRHPAASSP